MRPRRGFVLVAAIAAIVLMTLIVAGVLFASSQESQSTSAEILDQKAFSYAERVAFTSAASWECPECDLLPVGSVIIRNPSASPPLESTVYITKLDSALFLVTGEGRIVEAGALRARRRVSVAVKITRDSLGAPHSLRIDGQSWAAAWQM